MHGGVDFSERERIMRRFRAGDIDLLLLSEVGSEGLDFEFCSVVARDNVVATQFHAEKSGELGLALLRGFAAWDAPC